VLRPRSKDLAWSAHAGRRRSLKPAHPFQTTGN